MILSSLSFGRISNAKKINFTSNPQINNVQKPDVFENTKKVVSAKEQAIAIQEYDRQIQAIKEQKSVNKTNMSRVDNYARYKHNQEIREQIKNLMKMREDLIKTFNPNVAFLSDSRFTWPQRRGILTQHPEIIPMVSLTKVEDSAFKSIWQNNNYFVLNKTGIGNMLDSSYELNTENYKRLTKDGLLSYSEIMDQYGYSEKELNRYVQDGYLNPIKLKNIATDEEEPVHVIDITDEKNINGIERHNYIGSIVKESPYINKDYLPAKYIAHLGFCSEKELQQLVKTKKLNGKMLPVKTKDGVKNELCIFHKKGAEGELKFLRNQNKNLMDVEQFAKRMKLTQTEVETAIVDGDIQIVPHYIYKSDKDKLFINLKYPKNAEFIDKKDFEQALIKAEKTKDISIRAKLAWALSTNTRRIAQEIVASRPELKEIFKKKAELDDYLNRKANDELKEGEMEPRLTLDDKIKIKSFYKTVWAAAGTDEYKQSFVRAKKSLAEYKEAGINAIQDEEAKAYIEEIIKEKNN